MPFRVDIHVHSCQCSPYLFLQSVLHKQRSVQVMSFLLHEHLWVELLDLQWELTNSTIACRAPTVLVVCDLCRPDCSHVWMGQTTVVTWLSPGTKLLCTLTRSICSSKAAAVGDNLLLSARCLQSIFHLRLRILAIWIPFGEYAISIHSWPTCLSPALDRRLQLFH